MDRRGFLSALATGLVLPPGHAAAQPQGKVARIGVLVLSTRQFFVDSGRYKAFLQGMRDLGYVEGTHFIVEGRYADGKSERLPALAAELVGMKVDVIVAGGGPAVRTVSHATKTIPIVVTALNDPVSDGFVASLARPGGNMTGVTSTAADLGPKHLELLKTATPKLSRVAVLLQPGNPGHPRQFVVIFSAAQKVGIQLVLAQAGAVEDIERASAFMAKERAQAVIVLSDNFFNEESQLIAAQAMKHRLTSVSSSREFTEAGGLMSYGASLADNLRHAATYVDKILNGAKPGDLPFEQPTRYSLVINGQTAKALGLTIPPALLQQAEVVIQ
jgi:putative ABC transport system substrate-binding protein